MHDCLPTARPRPLPIWLPFLAAPAFALLPVAGCGAAASLRHGQAAVAAAASQPATPPPLVPVTAVVTALPRGR